MADGACGKVKWGAFVVRLGNERTQVMPGNTFPKTNSKRD